MMESKFDDIKTPPNRYILQNNGYCDHCRKPIMNALGEYQIILKEPSSGIQKLLNRPRTFKLCQTCYVYLYHVIEKNVLIGRK